MKSNINAKQNLIILLRFFLVSFSLMFIGRAFYRWDGYSLYMKFTDLLPQLSLSFIVWAVTALIITTVMWFIAYGLLIFTSLLSLKIRFEHVTASIIIAAILLFMKNIFFSKIPLIAIIGLSDHSLGIGVAIASIAKGARIIEKHVTLDRSNGAVDSAFSLEPHEFKLLCEEGDRALKSIGKVKYAPGENEKNSLKFRRSIYISENVKKGDVIAEDNIKIIRPSYGLEPKLYEDIIGKKFNDNFLKGTALKKQYISDD